MILPKIPVRLIKKILLFLLEVVSLDVIKKIGRRKKCQT